MNGEGNGNDNGSSPRSASRLYTDRSLKIDDLASLDSRMTESLERARLAATREDLEILIVGETGTGKNLLALAIHNESPRRAGPFVALNTGAVPESLIGSELFGHEKGAFTGAHGERRGVLQMAHGGTLFLDELGNMRPELQTALLTAVEDRTFRRVGGSEEHKVDFRTISATNADLDGDIDAGAFRSDLYYRLCRVVIRVPPLRERRADILPFARRFLAEANEKYGCEVDGFTPECEERILAYDWPGNVRLLRSAVSSAVSMSRATSIGWKDLAENLHPRSNAGTGNPLSPDGRIPPVTASLALVERWHLERAMEQGWSHTQAASLLGISRRGLYDKLKRHGLDVGGASPEI